MSIISIKNLVHQFAKRDDYGEKIGTVTAVDGINLEVEKGDFISILGRNGSGKSTLAKHINALLFPTSGKVYVNGFDTEDEELMLDIRKSGGMVFQNPDNQIIATVVEEDVAFGPENIGIQPPQIRLRVDESLKATGMYSYRNHSPNKLSGGQKQRVAIAGVLAMKPACIILDEPTAMLDPVGRKEVLDIVQKLNREESMTVILVTHHMDEVISSDKVYVMDSGHIALSGTPFEVFSNVAAIKKLGLDVPQVTEVSYELGRLGYDMPIVLTEEEFTEAFSKLAMRTLKLKGKNDGTVTPAGKEENNHSEDEISENSVLKSSALDTPLSESSVSKSSALEISSSESSLPEPVLILKDVNYTYSPDTVFAQNALRNINLTVRKGEFIALIGHTGSGKSTLIRHLNGLEKPTSGQVLFKGEDINTESYNRKTLRGRVGMVFQYPEHQLFEVSIYKDVAYGPINLGLDEKTVDERVIQALTLVGVDESRWKESPLDLSGGQKRRVAIAGVLAMKPEVLILDEPTAGLDPAGRDEILGQIQKIYEETGITVILVSHSMEDVAKYAERIVVMNEGQIRYDGIPTEVFRHRAELEEMGLAVPQVTGLLNTLKTKGFSVRDDIIKTKDCEQELASYLNVNGERIS
ncbi:MAG: energy-coupling factor transporter ATPase [Lachnospiraceae bacterium]